MGLDIKFNLVEAMVAGMVIHAETNGDKETIAIAEQGQADYPDAYPQEHLDWLKEVSIFGSLPDYPYSFMLDGIGTFVFVRANKWGELYEPLTTFLKSNNILWDEL
jgi:hypothetical protein